MPNARRFALSALLVLGSAVLAGLVATLSTPRYAGARVPRATELPWPASSGIAERRLPFLLLYIDSHCGHCSRAAVLVDSIATLRGVRAIIATRDSRADAQGYQQRLHLRRPLALDSAGLLMHAIGTRAVPTLILFHADGSRQLIVGFSNDGRYRHTLTGFAR